MWTRKGETFDEQDDHPEPARPPEGAADGTREVTPAPGRPGLFDVVEWRAVRCERCGGRGGTGYGKFGPCPDCDGTGLLPALEAHELACDLERADALLLARGAALLAAAESALAAMLSAPAVTAKMLVARERLAEAVRAAKGA